MGKRSWKLLKCLFWDKFNLPETDPGRAFPTLERQHRDGFGQCLFSPSPGPSWSSWMRNPGGQQLPWDGISLSPGKGTPPAPLRALRKGWVVSQRLWNVGGPWDGDPETLLGGSHLPLCSPAAVPGARLPSGCSLLSSRTHSQVSHQLLIADPKGLAGGSGRSSQA